MLQDEEGNSNQGIGEIIVAKHRNGALDSVRLRFIGEYARFDNIEGYSDDATPIHTSIGANTEFDENPQPSYTMKSKMDSHLDDLNDFSSNFENGTPF